MPRPRLLPSRGIGWWALSVAVALLTARLTMDSVQFGCAIAILVLTVCLYVRDRAAGLVAVWLVWLLIPLLRRILFQYVPSFGTDPLAVVPFLVTAAVVSFELSQATLSRRTRRLLLLGVGGYAIGLPLGALASPKTAAFALFAYLTALGCFVIGYREAEQKRLTLPSVLMIVTPLLALYAFRQYYFPLPKWDLTWLHTAGVTSATSSETGRIRVWSTLNSPATFATVLGVAAITLVTWRKLTPVRLVSIFAVLGALALTYVRSVWAAILFTGVAILLATRGGALKRLGPVIILLVLLAPVVLGGSTRAAISDRFGTFGSLGQDTSAQARLGTSGGLIPQAFATPLGNGLGSAGEANKLSGSEGLRYSDNGYLAVLVQTGPVGFLTIISVIIVAIASACRNVWRRGDPTNVLVFGALTFLAVTMVAGDVLFGITGMIFWYLCGLAVRRRELLEEAKS